MRLLVAGSCACGAGLAAYEHYHLLVEVWSHLPAGWQNCICFAFGWLVMPLVPMLLYRVADGFEKVNWQLLRGAGTGRPGGRSPDGPGGDGRRSRRPGGRRIRPRRGPSPKSPSDPPRPRPRRSRE